MSFGTPHLMASGQAFHVVEVNGQRPDTLEQFDGNATFVLDDEAHSVVHGQGRIVGGLVRFHEKDATPGGKDVRVWHIRPEGEHFLAEHAAAF